MQYLYLFLRRLYIFEHILRAMNTDVVERSWIDKIATRLVDWRLTLVVPVVNHSK